MSTMSTMPQWAGKAETQQAADAPRAAQAANAAKAGRTSRVAAACLCLLVAAALSPAAARGQSMAWHTERPGPYLLFAAGGSQYEYDCRSSYYYADDCAYGRAGAGKVGLGYRFGRHIGVEGAWVDYGRARVDNGRTPRDSLRMQSLGVSAVFSLPFGPATEGLLRVGLADVRHSRSDDTGAQRVFTATAGLAMVLHLGPLAALEVGWDATTGEGRDTGTTAVGALTAGLRLSF